MLVPVIPLPHISTLATLPTGQPQLESPLLTPLLCDSSPSLEIH